MSNHITLNEAIRKASTWLKSIQDNENPLELLLEYTIERPYGWFFFYDSKRFIDTGDFSYMLAGNAPILIDNKGIFHQTGTSHGIEYYLSKYDGIFGYTT